MAHEPVPVLQADTDTLSQQTTSPNPHQATLAPHMPITHSSRSLESHPSHTRTGVMCPSFSSGRRWRVQFSQ